MIAYPDIDPIAFEIGQLKVRWYGLSYAAGIVLGIVLGKLRAKSPNAPITEAQVIDLVLFIAVGAILGGRLGYTIFYNFSSFATNPLYIFKIWEGGMSFHGGLLGAIVGLWLFGRRMKIPFLIVADFISPAGAVGLFFGRIANFINQELWGRPTDVSWAIVFPHDPLQLARHPSQLYEAALEGLVLFAILWLYSAKPRPVGRVSGLFVFWYGVFRFVVEFFREPDAELGFVIADWMTMGQILSLPLIALGIILYVFADKISSATNYSPRNHD